MDPLAHLAAIAACHSVHDWTPKPSDKGSYHRTEGRTNNNTLNDSEAGHKDKLIFTLADNNTDRAKSGGAHKGYKHKRNYDKNDNEVYYSDEHDHDND